MILSKEEMFQPLTIDEKHILELEESRETIIKVLYNVKSTLSIVNEYLNQIEYAIDALSYNPRYVDELKAKLIIQDQIKKEES